MPQTDPAATAIELAERIAAEVIRRDPDWERVTALAHDLQDAATQARGDTPSGG